MRKKLSQRSLESMHDAELTAKKLSFNYKKNRQQDQTEELDRLSLTFNYRDCKDKMWNPESYSLLWGTPIWDQASSSERTLLNQLYWVAYYSQIISAEIATIFFNQTAAAGLYSIEDFRLVCDTLDFESMQERAHISAFKNIAEQIEEEVFGERIFTYPMRPYFYETMIFQNTNWIKKFWKRLQLQAYSLLSSGNAFIACQYLTVRGLRTLNGKIVQHDLSQFHSKSDDKENTPIPSKVSYHHFLDESYHFNSSNLIGSEIIKILKNPTWFEKKVANMGIAGTLKDHANFNVAVRGIFWYEPALFSTLHQMLCSKAFGLEAREALQLIEKSFCHENDGIQESFRTHQIALESYKNYLEEIDYVSKENKAGGKMSSTSLETYLKSNRQAFRQFRRRSNAA